MKRHWRCSIGGSSNANLKYHYSDRFFTYLMKRSRRGLGKKGVKAWNALPFTSGFWNYAQPIVSWKFKDAQSELKTLSGGEFGWGGTSVKR